MVASVRVTLRKTFILIVCCACLGLLLLYTRNTTFLGFPSSQFLEGKRTVLEHNAESVQESVIENVAAPTNAIPKPEEPEERDWYFKGGTRRPQKVKRSETFLLPEQAGVGEDRIQEQLMYIPEDYEGFDSPEKVILMWNGLGSWAVREGTGAFQDCPVSRCSITTKKTRAKDADAILFKDFFSNPGVPRPMKQVWILYLLECPYHTPNFARNTAVFNWTATYRVDSDIVAPYERWTYYDPNVMEKPLLKTYAANKSKKVAWFVSNCNAMNDRLEYAKQLSQYISVDIYGFCGTLFCPRSKSDDCFELLNRDYKFYLAFENSNCKDYITEKLFLNGLGHNVIPIVMGARPEDYKRAAPLYSYIHVEDFDGPEQLAEYLHQLDENDDKYNSYFRWKGTGEMINTHFWCRLCTMLHAPLPEKTYPDISKWWRGPSTCTRKRWKDGENTAWFNGLWWMMM